MRQLDNELLTRFANGDYEAFTTIFNEYHRPLREFGSRMVPWEEAEDIVANVFCKLWKTREEWNTIINVKAFLYISVRNGCFDYLRNQKLKSEKEKQLADIIANENDLLTAELEVELIREIYKQVQALPENSRKVFIMSYFEGCKNAEIAEILGISEKTVRNLKSAALKKLKTFFSTNQLTVLFFCPMLIGLLKSE